MSDLCASGGVPESWVRARRSNRAMAGLVVSAIGLGLLAHGGYEGGLQLWLRAFGTAVEAEVEHVFRGRSGERTRLALRFEGPDGNVHAVTVPSASSAYQPGQTAELLVVESVPRLALLRSHVRSKRRLYESLAFTGIGSVLTPTGLWLYLGFRRRAKLARGRIAYREADGRVLGLEPRPYQLGSHRPQALRYEFRAHDGRLYTARSPDLPPGLDVPDEGWIRVRYVRSRPARSLPILGRGDAQR